MGAAPDESKVHQNYIRTRYRVEYRFYIYDIGYDVGFTDVKTCSWHYDIGYDIVANYDIVYDIVPDVTKYIPWRYDVTFFHDISPDIVGCARLISVYTDIG